MDTQKTTESVGMNNGTKNGIGSEVFLRFLGFVFTISAAIVLGVDKQFKVVPVSLSPNLPSLDVSVLAKWTYLSAFKYFVVVNALACAYSVISIFLIFTHGNRKSKIGLLTITIDILMVALLSSCVGAAGAIGVMGFEGNSHVQWNKVCNVFGKFCHQAAAAIALSLLGSLAFILLVATSLHRKAK